MLRVFGRNGKIQDVSMGFGLGIREHDDVMLAWGLSRKTYLEVNIPVNNFAIIKVVVPEGWTHHAEGRILETSAGSVRVKVYKDVDNGNFPALVSLMSITDESKPSLIVNSEGTIFSYHGTAVTNPIITGDLIDNYPVFGVDSQGQGAKGSPAISESLRGRHYESGTYSVVIQNISNETRTIYYQYNWHEYI